jgi:CheY-like chemotaxis protein
MMDANLAMPDSEPISKKRMRVLIVEDNQVSRQAMARLMRDAGADVVTARDGEEGLGYLLTQRFDGLLTDLRMPVMDGVELVNHCMRLPDSHRPSRVVAISGEYDSSSLRDQSVEFLPKPLNVESLLKLIGGHPN